MAAWDVSGSGVMTAAATGLSTQAEEASRVASRGLRMLRGWLASCFGSIPTLFVGMKLDRNYFLMFYEYLSTLPTLVLKS